MISSTSHNRNRDLPPWRSLLYVPVTNDRFIDAAHTRGADAVILDLEDSVALALKSFARDRLAAAVQKVSSSGVEVLVRINRPWRLALRDIEAAVSPNVRALVLPKVDNANHIRVISEMVAELEAERGIPHGSTGLVALVETAEAFSRMEEIAYSDPRLLAMSLGAEDFAASCGMTPSEDALYLPKMTMMILARAAGLIPLGFIGTIADFRDLDGLRTATMRSRQLGFMASSCIHPGQVPIINEAYKPSADEVAQAQRVMAAAAQAERDGVGAYSVDGKMVDFPIMHRAR